MIGYLLSAILPFAHGSAPASTTALVNVTIGGSTCGTLFWDNIEVPTGRCLPSVFGTLQFFSVDCDSANEGNFRFYNNFGDFTCGTNTENLTSTDGSCAANALETTSVQIDCSNQTITLPATPSGTPQVSYKYFAADTCEGTMLFGGDVYDSECSVQRYDFDKWGDPGAAATGISVHCESDGSWTFDWSKDFQCSPDNGQNINLSGMGDSCITVGTSSVQVTCPASPVATTASPVATTEAPPSASTSASTDAPPSDSTGAPPSDSTGAPPSSTTPGGAPPSGYNTTADHNSPSVRFGISAGTLMAAWLFVAALF